MVSTGYLQEKPIPINGEDLLRNLEISHQEKLRELTITASYSGPETFISYEDPLIIILEGLIDNSIKHGLIEIAQPRIDIEMVIKDNSCKLYYQDNGKGIPENIKDQIFQSFFTTSRGNEETSGLDLYAIDNIVKYLFKGSLKLENSQGFKLSIQLPNL
jgi:signal transduction histidine kinase